MICSQCGKVNGENSKFCVGCGAPLTPGASSQPSPQQKAGAAYNQPVEGPYGINYLKGCASQAWEDIRHSGHWASRSFILGLLQFIPILRWTNVGYYFSLGKHSARGNSDSLPGSVVSGENFKNGFFIWLIGLIIAIILGLIAIPFWALASVSMPVGWLFVIVFAVFAFFSIFYFKLMMMRYTLIGFDETFKLGKVWKAYKRRFGKLFCLDFLPTLLIGLIQVAVILVFTLMIWGIIGSTNIFVFRNGIFVYNASIANSAQLTFVCVLLGLVGIYFVQVLQAVASMIVTRAYGIYIARYVPEWVEESQQREDFDISEGYVNQVQAVNPVQPADTGLLTEQKYANVPQRAGSPVTQTSKDSSVASNKPGSDKGTSVLGSASVVLVDGNGKEYQIDTFPAVVGKGSAANCIITGDESVSRVHAKIHEYGDSGFVVEDLKSSNKTYLNGNELQPEELVILSDGDTLKLGKTKLSVKFE